VQHVQSQGWSLYKRRTQRSGKQFIKKLSIKCHTQICEKEEMGVGGPWKEQGHKNGRPLSCKEKPKKNKWGLITKKLSHHFIETSKSQKFKEGSVELKSKKGSPIRLKGVKLIANRT